MPCRRQTVNVGTCLDSLGEVVRDISPYLKLIQADVSDSARHPDRSGRGRFLHKLRGIIRVYRPVAPGGALKAKK